MTSEFDSFLLLQDFFDSYACIDLDPLKNAICSEHISICASFEYSQLQDAWSWRNVSFARELASRLIDDKGEFLKNLLVEVIQLLEKNLFSLGPFRYEDGPRQKHILKILKLFLDNSEYIQALKRIFRPESHLGAEKLIRESLLLPEHSPVSDAHARRAALAALLTSLRQNVGSCFATAPAILIQQDQPLQFLADIGQLLGTGRLMRVFEGVEYSVPLSLSWGMGDLVRPVLLATLGDHPLHALSYSLGLQAAFTAAQILDKQLSGENRRQACEELLQTSGLYFEDADPFMPTTADQIIKRVLRVFFKVTEKDVQAYQHRTIQGPLAEVMIQTRSAQSGKSLACARYLNSYEQAKSAFKALADNALLKSWEFTLASLSESRADFAKWNLYVSLGVNPEEPHGIGQSLYAVLQEKIGQINEEIAVFQSRYDHLFAQVKYLEGRVSRAATESEAGWIQAEYQIRRHEINRALSERDSLYDKGKKLQGLYPVLIDFYGKKIREYFQEVYDAEMHDVSANPFDDSPAGFRLMYKHGRAHTALWTMINSAEEYLQHLASFFVSTEIEINQIPELDGLQKEISEIVSAALITIKRPEFLESSFYRLAKAYREPIVDKPLENLERIKRKPWAYISGGAMSTLVSCYWGASQKPVEQKRWVESENELLAFLIDTCKELPFNVQRMYQVNPDLNLLAFSPTHAFLCKPGWKLFKKAWESDIYTYTWIRDHWTAEQKKFLDTLLLDSRMMDALIQKLLLFIPSGYRPVIKKALETTVLFGMTPPEFREKIMHSLAYEKWLQEGRRLELIAEELDSILYGHLPFFPEHQLQEKLILLLEALEEIDASLKQKIMHQMDIVSSHINKHILLSAADLRNIFNGLLISVLQSTRSAVFFHQKLTEAMQKLGLSYPEPLLFADTNWVKNVFGFIINPGTRNLELWRFDACGSTGRPISIWKHYLDGSSREEWGLYTSPRQYGLFNS